MTIASVRRTKIVCTIGPASQGRHMLGKLMQAGMDVARLNFSHGDHASHARVLADLRQAAQELGREVGILQDLAGPKIRLGILPDEGVFLQTGQEVALVSGQEAVDALPVNYPYLYEDVEVGERLLLADGLVEMEVRGKQGGRVICEVLNGGPLSSRKGVNLPTSHLRVPSFTDKDRADLAAGLAMGVDMVALSFVRHEDDLAPVRQALAGMNPRPLLIAKIEKPSAVERLPQILKVVDGIMVARGDLGVEMPLEEVPLVQKRIIEQTRQAGRVVITATQMLRSMVDSPRPTRAEATDVANAVIDGTDALMLSEETAAGAYPLEAVQVLDRIARASEPELFEQRFLQEPLSELLPATEAAISRAACWLAKDLGVAAIAASTTGGSTARLVARYRRDFPVVAFSSEPMVCRQLCLSWGVLPALVPAYSETEEIMALTRQWILAHGVAKAGDRIVVTAGVPHGAGRTNLIRVMDLT